MSFKTPIYCDRRVYDKRGQWYNKTTQIWENVFYFIKEDLTMIPSYENGREQLKESITITVYGGKPIAKEDKIILEDNVEFKVNNIVVRYIESNILVKDLLKQRIAEQDLILQ